MCNAQGRAPYRSKPGSPLIRQFGRIGVARNARVRRKSPLRWRKRAVTERSHVCFGFGIPNQPFADRRVRRAERVRASTGPGWTARILALSLLQCLRRHPHHGSAYPASPQFSTRRRNSQRVIALGAAAFLVVYGANSTARGLDRGIRSRFRRETPARSAAHWPSRPPSPGPIRMSISTRSCSSARSRRHSPAVAPGCSAWARSPGRSSSSSRSATARGISHPRCSRQERGVRSNIGIGLVMWWLAVSLLLRS